MKVAIIGSRSFDDYEKVKQTLSAMDISLIVSGHADGADKLGERYANEHDIPTKIFLPDWDTHGRTAGFLRNTDIINEAEIVVAFWDGLSAGTRDSIHKAKKQNKRVIIVPF